MAALSMGILPQVVYKKTLISSHNLIPGFWKFFTLYNVPYFGGIIMKALDLFLRKLADAENMGDYIPLSEEVGAKILEFIKTKEGIKDSDFHEFVESLQIEPPQAETFVYRTLQKFLTSK